MQTNTNLLLVSFACAFGVSLGVLILLALAYVPFEVRGPVFAVGFFVLSYIFYHVKDIKLIMVYSLIAVGLLFLLFPTFMYLGIPAAFPEREIKISTESLLLITGTTGLASLVLGYALMKVQFKGK